MVEIICQGCGDNFDVIPSRADKAKYCSMDCMYDKRGKRTVICKGCGDEFEVFPYREDTAKFCSKECRKARITTFCEVCGEEYEIHPYREDRTRFCSKGCQWEWVDGQFVGEDSPRWKGGVSSYRGPEWDEISERARKRDGYRCQTCGISNKVSKAIYGFELNVHHVTPYRVNENNSMSNLITLCPPCHQRLEQKTHRN